MENTNKFSAVNNLCNLLGDYLDLEAESFSLISSSLTQEGVSFRINELAVTEEGFTYQGLPRSDFTFMELLQGKFIEVESSLSTSRVLRKQLNKLHLLTDEVYELSFKTNEDTCPINLTGTVSQLKLRLSNEHTKVKKNYLSSLPANFIDQIRRLGYLIITIKLTSNPSPYRQKIIDDLILNEPQRYVNQLLNPDRLFSAFHFRNYKTVNNMNFKRLELWGIIQPKFSDKHELEQCLKSIPIHDLGIKNIIHLRFITENLESPILSNKELVQLTFESQSLIKDHYYLKSCLLNNLPIVY